MLSEAIRYKMLRRLEEDPRLSQRALAQELGLSLGRTNYCLQALMEKGWVKVKNFSNNKNKKGYAYLLTPKGIKEKVRVTGDFLKAKMIEHESLTQEIQALKKEVERGLVETTPALTVNKRGEM